MLNQSKDLKSPYFKSKSNVNLVANVQNQARKQLIIFGRFMRNIRKMENNAKTKGKHEL